MSGLLGKRKSRNAAQRGLTSVEFALCGGVFLTVLFACIEMGRLLWTWNCLNEVTRRAARLAAVCPVGDIASVRQTATFGNTLIQGLDEADIEIRYLDAAGAEVVDPATSIGDIWFVQARILESYQFEMLIPGFQQLLSAPDFTTTIPSESLGITPIGAGTPSC